MTDEEKESWRRYYAARGEAMRQDREYLEQRETEKGPPPPHSGVRDCPKCASSAVATRYCKGWRITLVSDQPCRDHKHPHLHRDCGRCGFGWTEAPADGYRTIDGEMLPGILYEQRP